MSDPLPNQEPVKTPELDFAQALILDMLLSDIDAAKEALEAGEFPLAASNLREAADKADQITELAPEPENQTEAQTIDLPPQ